MTTATRMDAHPEKASLLFPWRGIHAQTKESMAGSLTVAELINAYRLTNTRGRRRDDPRYARWWEEHIGTLPVPDLTQDRILQALERVRAEGRTGARAGSTVAFYLRYLRRVTAWGASVMMLSADPCAGMPLPKESTPPMRVVTEEEEAQLCEAFGAPYNLWVRFAILTGLKQSEQFTLLWRSVQLDQGRVLLPQSSTGAMVELSLPPDAVSILRLLRHAHPTSIWVFPDPAHSTRPADPHIFYDSRWTRTIERLGLPPLTWKDLRHTCGVRLAKQGVPIGEIASFLRQRELRQAYHYRAWLPGVAPKKGLPKPPRIPVFTEVTDADLRLLLAREATDPPLTFGDMCRLYAVHFLQQRPSRLQFERIYRQLFHQWEDRPLAGVSRKDVRVWYMGLAGTPSHANKALTFLQRVYNVAIYHMEVYDGRNPAVKMPRYPSTPRERFLSSDEAQRFIEGLPHLPPKPRAYLLTLLLTGARRSEAQTMRWTDVDWSTRLWKKPRTKNRTSQFVPLPAQVVEALALLPRTSEWVFPGANGLPWSLGSIDKVWQLVRRRWNMPDVTKHDLRRTCASLLAINGENLSTIQNVLNHKSLVHTSTYARLNTKAVDRALQAQADRVCSVKMPAPARLLEHTETQSSDDAAVCRLIEAAWHRLPEQIQDRYVHIADSTGTPIERLLVEAVDWHISDLETRLDVVPG